MNGKLIKQPIEITETEWNECMAAAKKHNLVSYTNTKKPQNALTYDIAYGYAGELALAKYLADNKNEYQQLKQNIFEKTYGTDVTYNNDKFSVKTQPRYAYFGETNGYPRSWVYNKNTLDKYQVDFHAFCIWDKQQKRILIHSIIDDEMAKSLYQEPLAASDYYRQRKCVIPQKSYQNWIGIETILGGKTNDK